MLQSAACNEVADCYFSITFAHKFMILFQQAGFSCSLNSGLSKLEIETIQPACNQLARQCARLTFIDYSYSENVT